MGLSRGLLTMSMMYGHNYELALAWACPVSRSAPAVVAPWSGLTEQGARILTKPGVVGARFAWRFGPALDTRMAQRVHEQGWAANYLIHDDTWNEKILASPGRFVIEHLGHVKTENGLDSPAMKFLLKCLDIGRCWRKLNPRFSSVEKFPFADTVPMVQKLVAYAPSRMVWGSDRPHPQYFKPMPNDGELVDIMLDWVPDEATCNKIFVDNETELRGFAALRSFNSVVIASEAKKSMNARSPGSLRRCAPRDDEVKAEKEQRLGAIIAAASGCDLMSP